LSAHLTSSVGNSQLFVEKFVRKFAESDKQLQLFAPVLF